MREQPDGEHEYSGSLASATALFRRLHPVAPCFLNRLVDALGSALTNQKPSMRRNSSLRASSGRV